MSLRGRIGSPGLGTPARQLAEAAPSNSSYRSKSVHENDPEANFISTDSSGIEVAGHIKDRSIGQTMKSHGIHLGFPHHHDLSDQPIKPKHDPAGRPLRRHGTETFGEVFLHPLKELDMHRQRIQAFESEDKEFCEKHPDKTNVEDTLEVKPTVRIVIHFRHLVGTQDVHITDTIVNSVKEPLSLTEKEILRIYAVRNTDELIDFFYKTGREYSLKIHKTVDIRAEIKDKKAEFDQFNSRENTVDTPTERTSSEDKKAVPNEETKLLPIEENKLLSIEGNKDSLQILDEKKEETEKPTEEVEQRITPPALLVDLNENVYLEIKMYLPKEEKPATTRRPIFLLPDPDLSDEIGVESSATWVELFGDVFYVGWLSTFTHAHHITGREQLGTYAAWFVVMWWTWCSSAFYSSRYDSADVMHHVYKMVELCGLVGMAASSNNFIESPKGFIIGYMVMKSVLLIEYSVVLFGAVLSGSYARKPLLAYVVVNSLGLILWGTSLLYLNNRTTRYLLWYISIFVEITVNILLKKNRQVSLAASHLGERLGLFTIIILGENCMGFITMVADAEADVSVVVAIMFGVIIIFNYFFMYFDDFSNEILNEVELSQLWVWLHFPLHLCQVAFGIALTDVITIYRLDWDNAVDGNAIMQSQYAELTGHVSGGSGVAEATHAVAEQAGHALLASLRMAFGSTGTSAECEEIKDTSFVFQAFWVTGGLILCLNALIKLVNTPVAAKWSRIICASRILNAIVFFGLSALTYGKLNGLAMLGIMMASLLLQSCIDLLD
ncbi:bacterial low temperature requirement A protein-domain-containing protein [Spinellus fusiger]|nr:bacterial low temperature requirement A protein-domain-containing protein [Spinellus fusiger]